MVTGQELDDAETSTTDAQAPDVSVINRTPDGPAIARLPHPAWKRTSDILISLGVLLLLAPVLVLIAAYIKCVSRGPVFFRHLRYGWGGAAFKVWKFRTMHRSSDPTDHQKHVGQLRDANATLTKMDDEYRLIRGGRWLRASAADELPQLFNVLLGQMSLVGPRPDVVPMKEYDRSDRVRFRVLPGMTGLWQVSGKNNTTFSEMMALDRLYVMKRSPLLDLRIILITIPAVISLVIDDRQRKAKDKAMDAAMNSQL